MTTEHNDVEFVTGISPKLGPAVTALNLITPFPPHPVPRGAKPSKVPGDHHPHLSLAERDRRWDALRKDMLMANLDVLVLLGNDIYWDMGIANIRYLTGVGAKMGSNALFFIDDEPVLYNAVAHMSQPFHFQEALHGWVDDIRIGHGIPELAAELKDRGLDRARIGLVGFSSTIQTTSTILSGDEAALKSLLPGAHLVDFGYAFQKLRMVKSEEEIRMLREAGAVAEKTIGALVGAAGAGATEAEVYAEMIRTQIANGGEPNIFNLFASGPAEHPESELWHLLHGSDQPMVPTTRTLDEGDLIVAEWHTKWGGYLVHTEYTCHVGPRVPSGLRKLFDVALECFDASKAALVPGKTIAEAIAEIRRPADKAGINWVELGFHAMGLASPEFPTVVYDDGYGSRSLNGSGIGHLVLEEGMHFGNNIDLHDQAWKSDVGIMYGGSMVVRPGGAEVLVDPPKELGVS
jgi:Xaa-Pro aminopeptidase